ncbi:uncharacterized protein LOC131948618 isoform X2 [Physella acuta]|uniref:uncharacterized protein LOC131948618 isoform X2 n=1 Tax=Physella acuta TaxID=109671 RepID=UPI0027DABFB6|nr:uncharacterized protein LOC131948618 isoform X2 [Physella acuta]
MATVDEDDLTEREIAIIASCSAAVGVLLVIVLVVVVWLRCAKRKEMFMRTERLQSRLQATSIRDPLEEMVIRESKRNFTHPPSIQTSAQSTLYKVWNLNRTKKQFVYATSLKDLIEKATEKLELKRAEKIVLEEDGTEVSSDDVLAACVGAVLMVLEDGEEWVPSISIVNLNSTPGPRTSGISLVNGYSFRGSLLGQKLVINEGEVNDGFVLNEDKLYKNL